MDTLPPASATSLLPTLRLAIFFNAKKRRTFLAPLFPESSYVVPLPDDDDASSSATSASRSVRIEVVPITAPSELDSLGPFDVLLLKLTDAQSAAQFSLDPVKKMDAQDLLAQVREFIARRKTDPTSRPLTVIEPLERVEKVLSRAAIQQLAQKMIVTVAAAGSDPQGDEKLEAICTVPDAFLYCHIATSPNASAASNSSASPSLPDECGDMPVLLSLPATLRFPVMCKSVAACGSAESHRMYVLQRAEDFDLMRAHAAMQREQDAAASAPSSAVPSSTASFAAPSAAPAASASPAPVWLVQRYINHSGVLYKVYVLGDEKHVLAKRSLPDLPAGGGQPWWLNSQDMRLRPLRPEDEDQFPATSASAGDVAAVPLLVRRVAQECVRALRELVPLSLFGFDLIAASDATAASSSFPAADAAVCAPARFHLIDVNYFPSFSSVEGLRMKLLQLCVRQHTLETSAVQPGTSVS